MKPEAIAIFCGSKTGANPLYLEHATALGKIMADNKLTLVYGGGSKGLMGAVADCVMGAGGVVRGVIPQVLVSWEHQHDGLSTLEVVDDMHVRKRRMYELCDAAIILPGGFGTLDEFFEMLTWNQLSIHDKKIFILNTLGFYDHLLMHMEMLAAEGFLYGELRDQFTVLSEPAELLEHWRSE